MMVFHQYLEGMVLELSCAAMGRVNGEFWGGGGG
jgi:hypothetical protein